MYYFCKSKDGVWYFLKPINLMKPTTCALRELNNET